jgi:hypothetical protein
MIAWLFDPHNSAAVGALGLIVGLVGFPLTVVGIWLTYRQARDAETAAHAAERAASELQFRIERYSAYRDISEASVSIDAARRHLANAAWADASEMYELARRAVVRVHVAPVGLEDELRAQLRLMADHMAAFCDRVDSALGGKGTLPDATKVYAAIRQNYETLVLVKTAIEEGISR